MSESAGHFQFTAKDRQELFLQMAAHEEGVTAQRVHEEASRRGDAVTIEAYHNLGRRLVHRGLLLNAGSQSRQTVFKIGSSVDGQWLDEEQLAAIIDPEYPLIALTVVKEARRQLNAIPEAVWIEVRARLQSANARQLFLEGIRSYADDLRDALEEYWTESESGASGLPHLRGQIDASIILIKQIAKYGLGLSNEAIRIPANFAAGLEEVRRRPNAAFYSDDVLRDEIERRVSSEMFVVEVPAGAPNSQMLIAAVDGSTRGGLLSLEGEDGDFTLGHAPSISINTSTAQINRRVRIGGREYPAFLRLPEKPEDMQQSDNRYTVMAKLFFPELSESQYAHSVWNAMNLLESRAAIKVMRRWYTSRDSIEVRPADVILMDGTVTPNDRDSNHYAQPDAYGRIVRDLIEVNCEMMQKSRDDKQVVAGVVKNAQLRVLGPIINRFIVSVAAKETNTQIHAWPLRAMNAMPDQAVLTRLLTAGRKKDQPWFRTCYVLRPFHATTDFSERYSRDQDRRPAAILCGRAKEARERKALGLATPEDAFWAEFLGERDPFLKLLENAWYAYFFLGAVPRLDQKQALPRFEVLVAASTVEADGFKEETLANCDILLDALKLSGFEVSAEHAMFDAKGRIDVVPRLLADVHHTVKVWAAELQSRVNEYIGYHLSRYIKGGGHRGIRIRPWRRAELQAWITQMTEERRREAGNLQPGTPPSMGLVE
jgi:hypothetical protein